jgi:hypothetical protein
MQNCNSGEISSQMKKVYSCSHHKDLARMTIILMAPRELTEPVKLATPNLQSPEAAVT